MTQDWVVDDRGQVSPLETQPMAERNHPYRLYRFLTEVEDILAQTSDPQTQLQQIVPRVRYLLDHSPWIARLPQNHHHPGAPPRRNPHLPARQHPPNHGPGR
jgi:hypothetical protein